MCGICGVLDLKGRSVDPDLVRRMASSLGHRGPDGEGYYVHRQVGLGHRRLSIIDVAGGAQPISNEDDTIHISFNGEIYNFIELRDELVRLGHRFKTRSDTEVILHGYEEWGLDCVTRLNGMFAFAIWDEGRQRLFIARDHLGVKPLYYSELDGRFVFASEIKALLEAPGSRRSVDLAALSQLFTLRFVPSPKTMFEGIRKLPPAHRMVVDSKGVQIDRYWRWAPKDFSKAPEEELIERYRALVEDAVRIQMRSDVPVGLFLSSGVDSVALLALMGRHAKGPVHTFTIGFEGGERSNETDDAAALAKRFGANHEQMIVKATDYERYFDEHLWNIEEPLGNETAAAFYFVSLIASRKVKVALTGQGVDEPWAGYHRHMGVKLSDLYCRLPSLFTDGVVRPIVEGTRSTERLRRGVAALSERDALARMIKIYSFYSPEMKAKLFQPWLQESISLDGAEAREVLGVLQADVASLDPLTQMLYVDTRASLPDDLLMVADKTAMANSLEARVPYLDYRIVEFTESLPPHLKLNGLRGKYLHKKALEKWVPNEVVYRKKKGFDNPIDKWLRSHMKSFVGECLLGRNSAVSRYFDQAYVRELLANHEAGVRNHLRHLYVLISFEMWHRRFMDA